MVTLDITQGIADLCLSRPPVNALDGEMLARIEAALDAVEASDARVLLLRSDQSCFCAGADLAMIRALFDAADPQAAMQGYVTALHRLFDRLERLPVVTLAVISGAALGGGLELALACDMRIAAQEASLGLPEAAVGLLPGAGGTQRLTRLCGPGAARRIILSAERINGTEAHRLGLVQGCAPRADLMAEAQTIATRIAGLAPAALKAAKTCLLAAAGADRTGFAVEQAEITGLMGLPETRTRIDAFFARKAP